MSVTTGRERTINIYIYIKIYFKNRFVICLSKKPQRPTENPTVSINGSKDLPRHALLFKEIVIFYRLG